jgi:hypothetical protein
MKKELFAELVESIKEGGKILNGAAKPKRSFKYCHSRPKRQSG